MAINLTDLKSDIDNTPNLLNALNNGNLDYIVASYAEDHATETKPLKYMFNKRVLYANLGMTIGLPIICALEQQTEDPNPLVALKAREILLLLNDLNEGCGVDASHVETHAAIDELIAAEAMTQETGDIIKGWGKISMTKGLEHFGYEVTLDNVKESRYA